jgi:hypothetical protein
MNATTFDTLEAAKELRAAGFSETQSEALSRVVRQAGQIDLSQLATKADFQAALANFVTKADLRAELANFATKADFAEAKADILKWMVGAIGVQTIAILGAVVALVRLLPN